MEPKNGKISPEDPSPEALLDLYSYQLPPEAIAQFPIEPRDASRLLVLSRSAQATTHRHFRDLTDLLRPGDLLVLNDTRVIPARVFGRKIPGGGKLEVLLVRDLSTGSAEPGPSSAESCRPAPDEPGTWEVFLRATGRKRPGQKADLGEGFELELLEPLEGPAWRVRIRGPQPVSTLLSRVGHVPLPPYIRRADTPGDQDRYQTVFARTPGAVAAPTAGLHFTPRLMEALTARQINKAWVTLHVGPGTFQPLRRSDLGRGYLHEEVFSLPKETVAAVHQTREAGGRVIAVGTTTTRVLETCALSRGKLRAATGTTRLFIRPPYEPRIVDLLVTNFHLPRSSLLMLVASFAGRERLLSAYAEAVRLGYRFYSYGDAMLVLS
ncbi:tRNA preQ1(34) S-adenosylmethionine ribosyltransferase-isomerase QueA [Candidatus Eisenbacteria bacterium]|uniref:S-adenosylmethionine:tRNA ribosyltransferase-isomerase n=1 Tax=Eiseniibacteriota bacterium TaxID=2212470 RepID=A0ABV6YJU9_UNCEI